MKKTIKLNRATALKENLEKGASSIKEDNIIISRNNSIISDETREINIAEVEQVKQVKSNLLCNIHEAIQEVNLKKLCRSERSNAYYIKKLSEIKRQIQHWGKLSTTHGKQTIGTAKSHVVQYDAYYKALEVNAELKKLQKEESDIEEKIKKFNESNSITIVINDDEKKLLEELGY
jgi:cell division protein FtsB